METYTFLRAFADSWGVIFLMSFFVGTAIFLFVRKDASKLAKDASAIPFKED